MGLHVVKVANALQQELSTIWLRPKVEGKIIEIELDTGAAVYIISEEQYNAKFSSACFPATNFFLLKSYTDQIMTPLEVLEVNVHLNKQWAHLP